MSQLKVLYVDDEPDIREVALFALELDPELEVRTESCGADAVALLERSGWRPDVLLLDVMMPGMDGPTTLNTIRANESLAAIPAIFITARAQPHEREAFKALGARGVITKPFDPMSLAQELRAILAAA